MHDKKQRKHIMGLHPLSLAPIPKMMRNTRQIVIVKEPNAIVPKWYFDDVTKALVKAFGGISFLLYVQYQVPKVPANVISVSAEMKNNTQIDATKLYA